jgi:hypothetical protein
MICAPLPLIANVDFTPQMGRKPPTAIDKANHLEVDACWTGVAAFVRRGSSILVQLLPRVIWCRSESTSTHSTDRYSLHCTVHPHPVCY